MLKLACLIILLVVVVVSCDERIDFATFTWLVEESPGKHANRLPEICHATKSLEPADFQLPLKDAEQHFNRGQVSTKLDGYKNMLVEKMKRPKITSTALIKNAKLPVSQYSHFRYDETEVEIKEKTVIERIVDHGNLRMQSLRPLVRLALATKLKLKDIVQKVTVTPKRQTRPQRVNASSTARTLKARNTNVRTAVSTVPASVTAATDVDALDDEDHVAQLFEFYASLIGQEGGHLSMNEALFDQFSEDAGVENPLAVKCKFIEVRLKAAETGAGWMQRFWSAPVKLDLDDFKTAVYEVLSKSFGKGSPESLIVRIVDGYETLQDTLKSEIFGEDKSMTCTAYAELINGAQLKVTPGWSVGVAAIPKCADASITPEDLLTELRLIALSTNLKLRDLVEAVVHATKMQSEPTEDNDNTDVLKIVFDKFARITHDITPIKLQKLLGQTRIIDDNFTDIDANLIFERVKLKDTVALDFERFGLALKHIADAKHVTEKDIIRTVCTSEGPKYRKVANMQKTRLHDDREGYTGVHAHGGPVTVDVPNKLRAQSVHAPTKQIDLKNHLDRSEADVRGVKKQQ